MTIWSTGVRFSLLSIDSPDESIAGFFDDGVLEFRLILLFRNLIIRDKEAKTEVLAFRLLNLYRHNIVTQLSHRDSFDQKMWADSC